MKRIVFLLLLSMLVFSSCDDSIGSSLLSDGFPSWFEEGAYFSDEDNSAKIVLTKSVVTVYNDFKYHGFTGDELKISKSGSSKFTVKKDSDFCITVWKIDDQPNKVTIEVKDAELNFATEGVFTLQ